ncbi:BGTF surface domain-containing protein [Natronorubrum aibiense]|uniref:PGF-CTERM sorting domain-containing protein n=1 Tax=Natronorubrum aibiense TaxID=348826 RepID=A0A5P9P2I6_9EURY|nr:BGTF surface domain-containing protein [Natronorubrum aibiense]QFU82345.1 PGF-CTERM sorting domain-containing protein [Natronorubrum aibiense]
MTNDATYREKGRALFLAALMVMSVFAMSAAFAGGAAADDHADTTFTDASSTENALLWQGQEIAVGGYSEGDEVQLREDLGDDDDRLVTQLTANADGEIEFDTDDLDAGKYFIVDDSTDSPYDTFEVVEQSLDVEWDDSSVDNEGESETEIEFDSNRGTYNVNASADGLDVEDLKNIFANNDNTEFTVVDDNEEEDDDTVTLEDVEGTHVANFSDIDAGEYDFDFEVTDSTAEANDSIEVTEGEEAERSVEVNEAVDQGELAHMLVDTDGTDNSALQVGVHEDTNYEVGLDIDTSDYDDDEVIIQMNTYLAGQNGVSGEDDVFTAIDEDGDVEDDVTVNVEYANISDSTEDSTLPGLLGDGEYELTVGDDFTTVDNTEGEIDNEEDSAFLTLSERTENSDISTWTAPADDSLDDEEDFEDTTLTETDTIADGDKTIVNIEDLGHSAALEDAAESGEDISGDLADLGVTIGLEETNAGTNADPVYYNSSTGETEDGSEDNPYGLSLKSINDLDYDGENLYVVLDSDEDFSDDEQQYEVTYNVDEVDGNYIDDEDDEIEETHELAYEDAEFDWNVEDEDEVEISNATEITGETNVAPGTELDAKASSSGNFVEDNQSEVNADGIFAPTFDFSDAEPGTEFDLEERVLGDDVEDLVLVGGEEEAEADLDWNVNTDPAEPVAGDDVDVTVSAENLGDETGNASYEFIFGGDTLLEGDDVSLEGGESDSWSETVTAEEAGDYEWELKVDGEVEESGTLTVSEETTEDDGSSDDGSSDDGESEGTPGFGVAVAVVALLAAAMLALRRQN